MSFKDLLIRVVDAVAVATAANAHERNQLEEELIRNPRAFVDEWREYIPAELAEAVAPELPSDEEDR